MDDFESLLDLKEQGLYENKHPPLEVTTKEKFCLHRQSGFSSHEEVACLFFSPSLYPVYPHDFNYNVNNSQHEISSSGRSSEFPPDMYNLLTEHLHLVFPSHPQINIAKCELIPGFSLLHYFMIV